MNTKQFKKLGFESIEQLEAFLGRDDVRHMIGEEKYDHFRTLWLSRYASAVNGEPKKKIEGSFNWLALFASPLAWYGYRRMYALVFSLCGVFAALSFFDLYLGFDTSIPMTIAFLVLVFMSKDMYLGHLVRCTKKIDAMQDKEAAEEYLKWRKGPSTALAVLTTLFLLAVTLYVAVIMALELSEALQQSMYQTEELPYPEY